MTSLRGTKRGADENGLAADPDAQNVASQNADAMARSTPEQDGPRKKQRTGIPLAQKQALVENLQLEISERARKLRAQYNLQAQGLRTRIEIRVNRIPMTLRRANMGDLADKVKNGQHPQQPKHTPSSSWSHSARPPPVPEKDMPSSRPVSSLSAVSQSTKSTRGPGRPPKQASDQNSTNSMEPPEGPVISKQKVRSNPNLKQEAGLARNVKALSPSSTNIQPRPRATPGAKAISARPLPPPENVPGRSKSPVKQMGATNLFNNLAEKARSTRTGATTKQAPTTASSVTRAAKSKKPATSATTKTTAMTKTQRRASETSESSESSASTVSKKSTTKGNAGPVDKAAPAASKRAAVMGTIRKGVAGTATAKKAAATKAAPASTATVRVLRKRAN